MSSILTRPVSDFLPKRIRLPFARFGVLGKDITHFASVPLVFALAPNLILGICYFYAYLYNRPRSYDMTDEGYTSILLIFLQLSAYCIGIALGTGEEEADTRVFLRRLPIRAWQVLLGKYVAGIALVILYVIASLCMGAMVSFRGFSFISDIGSKLSEIPHQARFSQALINSGYSLTVLLTGITSGMICGNLSLASVTGAAFLLGVALGADRLMVRWSFTPADYDAGSRVVLICWNCLMAKAYLWAFGKERPSGILARSTDGLFDYLRYKPTRATVAFDPPARRLLRPTVITMGIAAAVLPWTVATYLSNELAEVVVIILLAVSGPMLGASVWSGEERISPKWFSYALPVSRGHIFRQRMLSLTTGALILGSLLWVGRCLAGDISNHSGGTILNPWDAITWLLVIPYTVAAALTASFLRMFIRLKLGVVVVTGIMLLVWFAQFEFSLTGSLGQQDDPRSRFIYTLWACVATSVLVLGLSAIAFCRTTLFEQQEPRRSTILVVIFAALAVWGGFLIAASPLDLLRMIL